MSEWEADIVPRKARTTSVPCAAGVPARDLVIKHSILFLFADTVSNIISCFESTSLNSQFSHSRSCGRLDGSDGRHLQLSIQHWCRVQNRATLRPLCMRVCVEPQRLASPQTQRALPCTYFQFRRVLLPSKIFGVENN